MNRSSVNWLLGWLCVFALIAPVAFAGEEHAATTTSTEPPQYRFMVDGTQTLPEMIAAGDYDLVSSNITTERFPLKGEGKEEIVAELAYFDIDMSSDAVLAELDRRNLRPATIAELLAFGAIFPEEQRKFMIVALGSVAEVRGWRIVPCLFGDGAKRLLGLDWYLGGWDGHYRFLAVRK